MAGRGGRGAALMKAMEELRRRPGERKEDQPPHLGEGDAPIPPIASSQTESTSSPSVGLSHSSSAQSTTSSSSASGPAPGLPMGRGAILRTLMLHSQQRKSPASTSTDGSSSPRETVSPAPDVARGSRPVPQPPIEQMAALSTLPSPEEKPIIQMHGELGKVIPMTANYIRLKVKPGAGVFEYHVAFNPQIDSKDLRFRLIKQQVEVLGKTRTFDGSKLYLPKRLPEPALVLNGAHPVDGSPVSIYFKFITQREHKDCIHLYNVIFRRIMQILKMTQIGRHYYSSENGIPVPAHKLQVWPGYVTAVDEFEDGLMLLCDVSHRVLQTTTVLEKLLDLVHNHRNDFKEMAAKSLLGTIVMTKYNNKTYRIDEIEWEKNPLDGFKQSNGELITYVDYYKKNYNLEILDLDQPLLLHRVKVKQGEEITKLICLIPELSVMTGLTDEMRSDFRVMKDLMAHTRVSPVQRKLAYQKFVDNVQRNEEAKLQLSSWGLEFDNDTVAIRGRVFDPERIDLKGRHFLANPECDWGREVTRGPCLVSVDLRNWCIIYFGRDTRKVIDFVEAMKRACPPMGMNVNEPKKIEVKSDRNDAFLSALREVINDQLQIVVIIFPTMREDRYNAVKKFTCCDHPIPSQVINARTISQQAKLRSITQKIALQMNCKLGGELWALRIPLKNVMVCGIDVYHEAARGNRSVAGFVSSINATLTRWYSRSCFQEPNQELVDGLRVCLIGALKKYFDVNHCLPDRIIMYRDGVGDGQLNVVANYEVEQLSKAFTHFGANYEPKLSVVVVQKRINTRLFAALNGGRQLENPPPGTVVDNTITRKHWYDFFLVSQHVRQGTVSPTHYVVIYDNNGLKPDQMQRLSYKLTHLYYNWPGTVRVPAPCQYAHKLASLVGQNLHKEASCDLSDRLFFL